MKQRIIQWLGFDAQVSELTNRVVVLEAEIAVLKATTKKPAVVTAGDIMKPVRSPFRVNPEPFRKRRAVIEQSLNPEYQAMQQRIRDEKAAQPRGVSNAS